jgi:hemin uptake protein HemP
MTDGHHATPPESDRSQRPAEPREPSAVIPSHELLRGTREVLIDHSGEIYRLRLTRNGKLILHK